MAGWRLDRLVPPTLGASPRTKERRRDSYIPTALENQRLVFTRDKGRAGGAASTGLSQACQHHQSMTRVVMIGRAPSLVPATSAFAPWRQPQGAYQARVTPQDSAAIDLVSQELCPRSRMQLKEAWRQFATLYCRDHAVDGWAPERAKARFAEANAYLETGADGRQHKVTASRSTLQRRWAALVEAGLIHVQVRGSVRLHVTHITLPGVLEHNGGFEPHADRVRSRLESRRRSNAARRGRALQGDHFSAALTPAAGMRSSGPVTSNALKPTESPKLDPLSPSLNMRPEHLGARQPTPYGHRPTSGPPPLHHTLKESHPTDTEERGRTKVEPAEASLPLTPSGQAPAPRAASQPDTPRRAEAIPPVIAPAPAKPPIQASVAATRSSGPATHARPPDPTGVTGVKDLEKVGQKDGQARQGTASPAAGPPWWRPD